MFTCHSDLILFTPELHSDERGFFYESYNEKVFYENGVKEVFLQDNVSFSTRGVLRGLHYQKGMSKLVRCTSGVIFDVAVNLTTGKYSAFILSGENKKQLFIPDGYAHGFLCLSETAEVSYKCSKFWNKEEEGGIRYDSVGIKWLLDDLILSEKDNRLPQWKPLIEDL